MTTMRKQLGWAMPFLFVAGMAAATAQTCNEYIPASAPDSRFTKNGDYTVTDSATGLMWKQCPEGLSGADCATGSAATFTWQAALQHAEAAEFAGRSDWRLPNKNELASLVEQRCYDPAIDLRLFPNTPSSMFWSSSPFADGPYGAWQVTFSGGRVIYGNKDSAYHVRLVRGGQ
jgi:hypothetical protein